MEPVCFDDRKKFVSVAALVDAIGYGIEFGIRLFGLASDNEIAK